MTMGHFAVPIHRLTLA